MGVIAPPTQPAGGILPPPPGPGPARTRGGAVIAVVAGILLGVIVVVVVALALREPDPETSPCVPGEPCGSPPAGSGALVRGTVWSGASGVQVEYNDDLWSVATSSSTELQLRVGDAAWLWLQVHANSTPQEAHDLRFRDLQGLVPDLAADTADEHTILGPSVGYRDGPGGAYSGTVDTAQGPGGRVAVAVMAAGEGDVTVVVSVLADSGLRDDVFSLADSLLNTFRWPSEAL